MASPATAASSKRSSSVPRPSSRTSNRAASPSVGFFQDTPVGLRSQISAVKHSMRQQQAQLARLEDELVRNGHPLSTTPPSPPPLARAATIDSTSPPPSSYNNNYQPKHIARRSSRDALEEIAGPDSSLPLPAQNRHFSASTPNLISDGIREGVPMDFAIPASPIPKRASSPTRTLSRIPVASVGNARALAEELGAPMMSSPNGSFSTLDSTLTGASSLPPPSPNTARRISLTPGGTTKVLADLQTGVANARSALENTKQQLRLSQRTVASLTRQTEDMKEARERLRLENEGLNNVVARKERLLQESIARARKAEEERDSLRSQLKVETTTSKKSLREMESALAEATALSQRREREYVTLRDSLRSLTESFRSDHAALRDEMRKREERVRKESEEVGKRYRKLVEECKEAERAREEVRAAKEEKGKVMESLEEGWREEIEKLKAEVAESARKDKENNKIVTTLSAELARLKRLMASARESSDPPDAAT